MHNIKESNLNNRQLKHNAQQFTIFFETANAFTQEETTFDEGNLRSV